MRTMTLSETARQGQLVQQEPMGLPGPLERAAHKGQQALQAPKALLDRQASVWRDRPERLEQTEPLVRQELA